MSKQAIHRTIWDQRITVKKEMSLDELYDPYTTFIVQRTSDRKWIGICSINGGTDFCDTLAEVVSNYFEASEQDFRENYATTPDNSEKIQIMSLFAQAGLQITNEIYILLA